MKFSRQVLIGAIHTYRWVISPLKTTLFGPLGRCRFTPSCSEYALGAVRRYGAVSGTWLALKRLLRCHPWGGCGHDPVPQTLPRKTNRETPRQVDLLSAVGSLHKKKPLPNLTDRHFNHATSVN